MSEQIIVRFVNLFTGNSSDVGRFDVVGDKVELTILPNAHHLNDTFIVPVLKELQKDIKNKSDLEDLIKNTSPYSSLQYFKISY